MVEVLGRYLDVWGAPAYVEMAGGGPPIVGIHTAGRDNRQWHGWMRHLGDSYTVVAPDLPGHGKSWPLPGRRLLENSEEVVDWLWAVCTALRFDTPIFAGCSMGGNFVLRLAQKHPGIRAIISMEGAALTPSMSRATLDLYTHPQVNFIQFIRGQSVGLIGSRAEPDAREFLTWQVFQTAAECQQADLMAYVGFDCRREMHAIRCPALFIRGSEDWLVSQEMVDAAAAAIPSAEVAIVPGGGHYVHAELPGEVCKLVREFLHRRLEPQPQDSRGGH